MQLTVVCLLGVAACAYAQIGFDVSKGAYIDTPFGTIDVNKYFGIGAGVNRKRRDVGPRDPPEGIRLPPGRGIGFRFGDRFKLKPENEAPAEGEPNVPEPPNRKLGIGAPGHLFPHPPPFHPLRGHHGRRTTTTTALPDSTESDNSSSEASSEENSEESSESSSEASSEAASESSTNASNEDSDESSNESSS